MEYELIKRILTSCEYFRGLDEVSLATLFFRGSEENFNPGEVLYIEGAPLDNTFCLVLSGAFEVSRDRHLVGIIHPQEIVGEMAYFTHIRVRTATVRAGPHPCLVLMFALSPAELASVEFSKLKSYLGMQAWDRFVSTTQCQV